MPQIAIPLLAAASTVGAIFVRSCLDRWSSRHRTFMLGFSLTVLLSYLLARLTGWWFTSETINELLIPLCIGGYCLLVSLLTLYRPFWLTKTIAFLVLVPIPIVILILLFGSLFPSKNFPPRSMGNDFYFTKWTWDAGAMGSSGTNLIVSYYPPYLPFLKHNLKMVRFNDQQCNSQKAFAVLSPDHRNFVARCPWWEYQHRPGFHDFLVPLH